MATYYVRNDGNDSNAGTGSATNQAWQTITKAIGATGIAPGDTLYIAPGIYRGVFTAAFTNPANNGQRITIEGNPTASQFSGVAAGPVIITNYTSNTAYTTGIVLTCDKDFVSLRNLCFCTDMPGAPPYYASLVSTSTYLIVDKCLFWQPSSNLIKYATLLTIKAGTQGPTVTNNIFVNGILNLTGAAHSGQWDSQTIVTDCAFIHNLSNANANDAIQLYSTTASQYGGIKIVNCYMQGGNGVHILNALSPTSLTYIQNCYIEANNICLYANTTQTTNVLQSYNILNGSTTLQNIATNATTKTNVFNPINASISKVQGWADYPFISPLVSSQTAINAGINTNSPVTDIYETTWLAPSTPTIGASEFQSYTPTGSYLPTERNASTITIAPGSTSQSIELYLGATGLTASTSGLSARYNRTRTASVDIQLVARTIDQSAPASAGVWISGGFAEVDSTNMPGVYRLDIPNEALAAGADDVTVVVRGASGTNGAVMTIKLSSGGLTSAQTASAVWGASPAGYATATTFGGVLNETNQVVNSTETIAQDIPGNVWDELRTNHSTVGTFGQYVNAELVTPVTSAALVRMGPYEVRADGLGASDPLDIQKGAQHGVDIQCVDAFGSGIDITSATVTAKVYNSGATLVDTYACTATYAADGRATFVIDTTVTNTPGTYTATITRTTGASDTQIFGPLRIYVRDI